MRNVRRSPVFTMRPSGSLSPLESEASVPVKTGRMTVNPSQVSKLPRIGSSRCTAEAAPLPSAFSRAWQLWPAGGDGTPTKFSPPSSVTGGQAELALMRSAVAGCSMFTR